MLVYVFLANGFEEVEALTPIDYLRRCEELTVQTVGVGGKLITSSHGVDIIPDITAFDIDMEKADMIVLPGGLPGTLNLQKSTQVLEAIVRAADRKIWIAAICAAPSILGHKGLLRGRRVTCAEGFVDELGGGEYTGEPVEIDGNIITARGAGVSNQFAFALIEKLISKEQADRIKGSVRY